MLVTHVAYMKIENTLLRYYGWTTIYSSSWMNCRIFVCQRSSPTKRASFCRSFLLPITMWNKLTFKFRNNNKTHSLLMRKYTLHIVTPRFECSTFFSWLFFKKRFAAYSSALSYHFEWLNANINWTIFFLLWKRKHHITETENDLLFSIVDGGKWGLDRQAAINVYNFHFDDPLNGMLS